MNKPLTDDKFAFIELCKLFLGHTHIPGKASGFNPSPDDEIICFDMCLSFPQELIDVYLHESGQGRGNVHSLRHLAHGVVNSFYGCRGRGILTRGDKYARIIEFVQQWKKNFKP